MKRGINTQDDKAPRAVKKRRRSWPKFKPKPDRFVGCGGSAGGSQSRDAPTPRASGTGTIPHVLPPPPPEVTSGPVTGLLAADPAADVDLDDADLDVDDLYDHAVDCVPACTAQSLGEIGSSSADDAGAPPAESTGAFDCRIVDVEPAGVVRDAANADPAPYSRTFQIANPLKLFSLLVVTGSTRMRVQDYNLFRLVLSQVANRAAEVGRAPTWKDGTLPASSAPGTEVGMCGTRPHVLPSIRSVRRQVAGMVGHLTARSILLTVPVNASKAGGRVTARQGFRAVGSNTTSGASTQVAVVLPSAYARLDVTTAPVLEAMRSGAAELDKVPLIRDERERAHGDDLLALDVDEDECGGDGWRQGLTRSRAHPGQVITVCVRGDLAASGEGVPHAWRPFLDASGDVRRGEVRLEGTITLLVHVDGSPTWKQACEQMCARAGNGGTAPTGTRALMRTEQPRSAAGVVAETSVDQRLATLLSCASHSHLRQVCDGKNMFNARKANEVEPLRPGDVVAVVKPLSKRNYSSLCPRMLVVSRWWFAPGEPQRLVSVIADIEKATEELSLAYNSFAQHQRYDASGERSEPLAGQCPYAPVADTRVGRGAGGSPAPRAVVFGQCLGVVTNASATSSGGPERYGPHLAISKIKLVGGVEPPHPTLAPTVGQLRRSDMEEDAEEPYIIYRFALYHDGFRVTEGKSASAEGVYLLPLNLPRELRRSSHAVRVLSVTPPGADVLSVCDRVLEDVLVGATEGFPVVCADGKRVRVFLDLVCWIADTPAVAQLLDTKGHASNAPCHLCSFISGAQPSRAREVASEARNRQRSQSRTALTSAQGHHSGGRFVSRASSALLSRRARTVAVHRALRMTSEWERNPTLTDLAPAPTRGPTQMCGLFTRVGELGLQDRGKGQRQMEDLPLHVYSRKLRAAAECGKIAVDSSGCPLLSGSFNPYRGLTVAPDHLLTGHFRDTVDAALKIMTPAQRSKCNAFMLGHMDAVGLQVQSDMVNVNQCKLHTMSMAETYALACVAEPALLAGFLAASEPVPSGETEHVDGTGVGVAGSGEGMSAATVDTARKRNLIKADTTHFSAALDAVASAAELMATFWMPRDVIRNVYSALEQSTSAAPRSLLSISRRGARRTPSTRTDAALEWHKERFRRKVREHLASLQLLFSHKWVSGRTGRLLGRTYLQQVPGDGLLRRPERARELVRQGPTLGLP